MEPLNTHCPRCHKEWAVSNGQRQRLFCGVCNVGYYVCCPRLLCYHNFLPNTTDELSFDFEKGCCNYWKDGKFLYGDLPLFNVDITPEQFRKYLVFI